MSATELIATSPIPSVPSLASITTAGTSPSDQQHTPPNIDEGELIEGKPAGWKRVFALGGLSRSSSLSSKHRKSASVGGGSGSGFIRKLSLRKGPTATSATTSATVATPPTNATEPQSSPTEIPQTQTHSATQNGLHIHSPSPQKRDFGLHIDLPQRAHSQSPYMSAPPTRPPSRSEHLLREALIKDGQTTTEVRRRTSTSSRAASRATSPMRSSLEWGTAGEGASMPLSPHEQVLRARLEQVLGRGAEPMPEMLYSNRGRRYSHSGETHTGVGGGSGGIWGWLWPQNERGNLDYEYQEPLSPLTYLPTPQTGSSSATSPPSASSTSGFFDSLGLGGLISRPNSRRNSINHYTSPTLLPPPRERSRTEPVLELDDEDEEGSDARKAKGTSRAAESLAAHYRKHGRSNSMTNVGKVRHSESSSNTGLARSSSVSSSIGSGTSPQEFSPSPTRRRNTKTPMFTLGLETVRSVADMRALAAEGASEGSVSSSSVHSNPAPITGGQTQVAVDPDADAMLTPPPTPPGGGRHEFPSTSSPASPELSPVKKTTPLPSRIPVPVRKVSVSAVREKAATAADLIPPVPTTPVKKTAPSTPAKEKTPARSSNPAATPTKSHPRIRSLSIQTSGERRVSQSTPCTPQRTKTFPATTASVNLNHSMPRTPQPQRKTFLGPENEARRPVNRPVVPQVRRQPEYAIAPDPTEFRVVDNPAAAAAAVCGSGSRCETPTRFNVRTASAQCKAQEGYVSFAMVEGLGEPEPLVEVGGAAGEGGGEDVGGDGERKKRWLLF